MFANQFIIKWLKLVSYEFIIIVTKNNILIIIGINFLFSFLALIYVCTGLFVVVPTPSFALIYAYVINYYHSTNP